MMTESNENHTEESTGKMIKEPNYEEGEITSELVDDIPCFCLTARFGLLVWGYFKIALDFHMMGIVLEAVYGELGPSLFIDILAGAFMIILAILDIVDFVFHAILIHGVHEKKVKYMIAYCTYTRVLWVLILLFSAVYVLLGATGIMWDILNRLNRSALAKLICIMLLGTLFQSLIMLAIINEVKKIIDEEDQVTSNSPTPVDDLMVKNKSTQTTAEKVTENDKINTDTEKNCEKENLI